MPMGEKGTPKSGQPVKWSWVTRRGALGPSLPCWGAEIYNHYLCLDAFQPPPQKKSKGTSDLTRLAARVKI